jgi:hypothetical protein
MAGRVAYVLGCSENPDVEPIKESRAFYPAAHPAWADFVDSQKNARFGSFCPAPIVVDATTAGANRRVLPE